ncbi:hypothetical protein [Mycobacterium ulcerans]|uniref:hypothetical protein n=1 Tax=Mycobacterium ulcerans TaxID=1809 RepID=UPI001E35A358|nr:hypothetical protein [Mycobacterium ulcerans]
MAVAASATLVARRTTSAACRERTAADISESTPSTTKTTPSGAPDTTTMTVAIVVIPRAPTPIARCTWGRGLVASVATSGARSALGSIRTRVTTPTVAAPPTEKAKMVSSTPCAELLVRKVAHTAISLRS